MFSDLKTVWNKNYMDFGRNRLIFFSRPFFLVDGLVCCLNGQFPVGMCHLYPFIYRQRRMCRETRPTSSHCSVDAGRDAAGGWWGEGVLGQHIAGETVVSVCDGLAA